MAAALICNCHPVFVLTQAIAGVEGFKRDVLNDNLPACMYVLYRTDYS
ncbi:hypothetical protein [Methylobacter svalbardensis]